MLSIWSSRSSAGSSCRGRSRRDFLRIGSLGLGTGLFGSLSLPDILAAQAAAQAKGSSQADPQGHHGRHQSHNKKAVIMILLGGGPSHQDMFDIKTEAPAEIRGEFRPIKTNVAGIEICEHLPRLAKLTDKLAIIRSIVGSSDDHALEQCYTGYTSRDARRQRRPSLTAVASRLLGPRAAGVPAVVGLSPRMGHMPWANPGDPGWLGVAHAPFAPNSTGAAADDMKLRNISLERLNDRMGLLASFDGFRREADASGTMAGLDTFHQQAMNVLTSGKLVEALNLDAEDPATRELYGRGDMKNMADGAPCSMDQILLARRLVEAGVRCVTLSFGRWDTHGQNFKTMRETLLPRLDQGVSALVSDLHQRGLDRDVSVVVWGEFGRTPRINKDAGRDHWPKVSCALLAGGGMRTGQVIGSTSADGGEARDRPVSYPEVLSTLYRNLGIDLNTTTLTDHTGRPVYLLEERDPLPELM